MEQLKKTGKVGKTKKREGKLDPPLEIGWCELVSLPDLGIRAMHAKIDSGAATSSLHAVRIKPFVRDDADWVSFTIPKSPDQPAYRCEARALEKRTVKSSNGHLQTRYVIETRLCLGPLTWLGHMTLANRQSMAFPVLIGRRALKRGFLVNSAKRWTLGSA